jgi:hypothetical protein
VQLLGDGHEVAQAPQVDPPGTAVATTAEVTGVTGVTAVATTAGVTGVTAVATTAGVAGVAATARVATTARVDTSQPSFPIPPDHGPNVSDHDMIRVRDGRGLPASTERPWGP